jgi:hypothetical protein
MFRKILLTSAALAALGAAALTATATPAAANGWNHHRHHSGWNRPAFRFRGPAMAYDGCYVRRVIHTPFGPRVRMINVCY